MPSAVIAIIAVAVALIIAIPVTAACCFQLSENSRD